MAAAEKKTDKYGKAFAIKTCKSAGFGICVILVLLLAAATLMNRETLPDAWLIPAVGIIAFLGFLSAAFVSAVMAGQKRLPAALASCGLMFLLFWAVGSAWGHTGFSVPLCIIVTVVAVIAAVAGSFLSTLVKIKRRG